jgi:hypothetical protein
MSLMYGRAAERQAGPRVATTLLMNREFLDMQIEMMVCSGDREVRVRVASSGIVSLTFDA